MKGARTRAACDQSVADEFRTWSQAKAVAQAAEHLQRMEPARREALETEWRTAR